MIRNSYDNATDIVSFVDHKLHETGGILCYHTMISGANISPMPIDCVFKK